MAALDVLFCGTGWLPIVDLIAARLPAGARIRRRDPARPLREQIGGAEVLLPSNAPIAAAELAAGPALRLLQQPAVGHEGIDLEAARARGVAVCNVPAANDEAMAEAALFLMLALARRLPRARAALAEGRIGEPLGIELRGRTLGLVGFGRSGRRLAEIARSLGMEILSVRSTSPPAELEGLLARADFLSLHCPLTPATRGLLDDRAFARMKPGAFLVNCARGPIVDRGALERALGAGRLGGFGADTFWEEPWDPADPLLARDDVVALPHVAGSTEESFARVADAVAGNVRRLLEGEPLLHRLV